MYNLRFRRNNAIQYRVNIYTFSTDNIKNMKLMLLMSKDHYDVSFFNIVKRIMERKDKIKQQLMFIVYNAEYRGHRYFFFSEFFIMVKSTELFIDKGRTEKILDV